MHNHYFSKTIGIIGGGQLGQMMSIAAIKIGFKTKIYTNKPDSPAIYCSTEDPIIAEYDNEKKLTQFVQSCNITTFEFENANSQTLEKASKSIKDSQIHPPTTALHITKNRLREKQFLQNTVKVPVAPFSNIQSPQDLSAFFETHKNIIVKTQEDGYDGKGQTKIDSANALQNAIHRLFSNENQQSTNPVIAEKCINFNYEASCIIARNQKGQIATFPTVKNFHQNGILHTTVADESIPESISKKIIHHTIQIANTLNYVGTMAVEYFVQDGHVVGNEIACRPHNSGHFSLDLCNVCQFSNHIRAISDAPLLNPMLLHKGHMLNITGNNLEAVGKNLDNPNARIHLYGKKEISPNRKIGHINFINENPYKAIPLSARN